MTCLLCWPCRKALAVPPPSVFPLSFSTPIYASLAGLFPTALTGLSLLHLDAPQKKVCLTPKDMSDSISLPFPDCFVLLQSSLAILQETSMQSAWLLLWDLSRFQVTSGELGSWPEWGERELLELKILCYQEEGNVRPLGSSVCDYGLQTILRVWSIPWVGTSWWLVLALLILGERENNYPS